MQLSKPCRAMRRRGVRGCARCLPRWWWRARCLRARCLWRPVLTGPVLAGPVLMGPVLAPRVVAAPVLAGVTLTGLVPAPLVLAPLVLAPLVLAARVLAGPAVVPAFVRVRVPGPGGSHGVQGGPGARNRHGARGQGGQRRGEQGRRRALHQAGRARRSAGPGEAAVPPPQAAQDGQHPAAAPGVGPGDRYARIRERGAQLLILGIAGHRPADLRQGPHRGPGAHRIGHAGGRSRGRAGRLDADRRGAADQVRGTFLVDPRLAEVDRVPVVPDTPAGITVQPVHWPARGDPDGVPGEPDYLEPGPAGLRREVHRGRPGARPRVRRRKCSKSRISKSHDQRKSDYPTHLHPPNAIAPATAGGRRQAFRLSIPSAFSPQAHRRWKRRRQGGNFAKEM